MMDSADTRRFELYRTLAERWRSEEVDYGVASGLGTSGSTRLGRDLDVLVTRESLKTATGVTLETMRDLGWEPVLKRRPWTTLITGIADRTDRPIAVEVDLFTGLQWFNVGLIERPCRYGGSVTADGIRFDPWAAIAKRILIQVLGGSAHRLRQANDRLRLTEEERRSAEVGLADLLGSDIGGSVLSAIQRGDVAWLESRSPDLRRSIARRALVRRPLRSLRYATSWTAHKLYARFVADRAAPIVALVGPDGVGKSSVIRELERILTSRFRFENIVTRHWRPGVLPPLGALRPGAAHSGNAGPAPPRREPGRFAGSRIAYYGVDFLIGYLLRDRPLTTELAPILYDRCLLDMAVDPARYGLRRGTGVRSLYRLIPRPDLVVFIDDDVCRIRDRKPELTEQELQAQLSTWHEMAAAGLVDQVVEAGNTPFETAWRIIPLIVDVFVSLGDAEATNVSPLDAGRRAQSVGNCNP
jgi:hypothetical protein